MNEWWIFCIYSMFWSLLHFDPKSCSVDFTRYGNSKTTDCCPRLTYSCAFQDPTKLIFTINKTLLNSIVGEIELYLVMYSLIPICLCLHLWEQNHHLFVSLQFYLIDPQGVYNFLSRWRSIKTKKPIKSSLFFEAW